MPFETLSPEAACEMLAEAGLRFAPSDVQIEAREERWVVRLPGHQLAWFAASVNGLQRLQTERRLLRLLGARCTFRVPRVLFESAAGGTAVGTMLAEQHSRINAAGVAGWLPHRPAWPESRE